MKRSNTRRGAIRFFLIDSMDVASPEDMAIAKMLKESDKKLFKLQPYFDIIIKVYNE